jgi:IstB-like ATP binding protein
VFSELAFEDRLAMLVQREIDWRDGKRLARLLKAAKLKVSSACIEDIDWLRHGHNVLITGATPSTRHDAHLATSLKFKGSLSRILW